MENYRVQRTILFPKKHENNDNHSGNSDDLRFFHARYYAVRKYKQVYSGKHYEVIATTNTEKIPVVENYLKINWTLKYQC